jgi:hypothetical protein
MKKTLILISMIALSFASMAQQGSWYIGGLVGVSSSKTEDTGGTEFKTTNWAFAPEFGTFLQDDIQLGIALGISGSKTTFDGDDESKSIEFDPTIYGRKFFSITDNFSLFAGLYLSIISETDTDYTPATVETKTSGFGARLGTGVAYALSPKFTILGQYGLLGFQSTKDKVDGDEVSKDTSFDFGMNTTGGSVFNVGIYYTFKQ